MNCPKCQQGLNGQNEACPHCGIIFKKYYKYHPFQAESNLQPRIDSQYKDNETLPLTVFLLHQDAQQYTLENFVGRAILLGGLIIWSWLLMSASIESDAAGSSFLHKVNLPFHEAGHVIFRPFGAFVHSLGGTLGQLLMPSICMGTLLLKTRDPFGASVALWWFGENFLDIAPYMNDARAGQLPLLGGNFGHSAPYGFHDWQFLLTESGLIQYDHILAKATFFMGSVIILFALLWGGLLLVKQHNYKGCNGKF